MNKLSVAIIIVQFILLAFFITLSLSIGIGWYISYQSWQDYIRPREQVFYDGIYYTCRFMGGRDDVCQRSVEGFYSVEAFQKRYTRGSQDWIQTQGLDGSEVY